MSDPRGRPDHVDAAWAMLLALLAVAAVWGLSAALKGVPPEGFNLLQQAAFFAAPLLYARAVKLRPFEASGYARLGLRQVALVLLASLGTMWLLQGLSALQMETFRWMGLGKEVDREIEQLSRSVEAVENKGVLFAALLFVVVAPVCEETLFRGLVFRGAARRFGTPVALVVTSGLFAAMHQTLVQAALMAVLGIYFGTLVRLTGSVWAGVIAHAANNFAVLVVTEKYGPAVAALRAPWWMYVLSAIVFAGAMTLLAMDRRGKELTSP